MNLGTLTSFDQNIIYISTCEARHTYKDKYGTVSVAKYIIYDVPADRLKVLGYFQRSLGGFPKRFRFKNPYNNEETDVAIDFMIDGIIHHTFIAEYPLECIISQQVPITSLLACQKNIPFDVMNIIQQFRIGEGNPKLQKLLDYCINISEKNFMRKASDQNLDSTTLNLIDVEAPKLPNEYPFEYFFDKNKYSNPKKKPLCIFKDRNLDDFSSSDDESI